MFRKAIIQFEKFKKYSGWGRDILEVGERAQQAEAKALRTLEVLKILVGAPLGLSTATLSDRASNHPDHTVSLLEP